jgi:hypothetical protein
VTGMESYLQEGLHRSGPHACARSFGTAWRRAVRAAVPRNSSGRPSKRLFRASARALDERLFAFPAPRCCLHRGPALRSGHAPIRERERAWTPRERPSVHVCVRREFCFSVFFGCSGTVGGLSSGDPSLKACMLNLYAYAGPWLAWERLWSCVAAVQFTCQGRPTRGGAQCEVFFAKGTPCWLLVTPLAFFRQDERCQAPQQAAGAPAADDR